MKLRLMLINAIEYINCLIRYAIHVIQLPYEIESVASIAKKKKKTSTMYLHME